MEDEYVEFSDVEQRAWNIVVKIWNIRRRVAVLLHLLQTDDTAKELAHITTEQKELANELLSLDKLLSTAFKAYVIKQTNAGRIY